MPNISASTMASSACAVECRVMLTAASSVHAKHPASQIHAVLRMSIGRCRAYAGFGQRVDYTFGYANSGWIGSGLAGPGQHGPFGTGVYGQFSGGTVVEATGRAGVAAAVQRPDRRTEDADQHLAELTAGIWRDGGRAEAGGGGGVRQPDAERIAGRFKD